MEKSKPCTKCGETKPLSEFHKNRTKKNGRGSQCKTCCKAYNESAKRKEWMEIYNRKYYEGNKKYYVDWHLKYYGENKDKLREYNRGWKKTNKDKVSVLYHKRRADKLTAEGTFSQEDIQALLEAQKNKCLLCGKQFTSNNSYSVDHIVPLSKGGRNDILNIQLLHKSCNSKKFTKTLDLRSKKVKRAIFEQQDLFQGRTEEL